MIYFHLQKKLRRPITCAAAYGHFSLVKHLFVKYNCDLRVKNKVSIIYICEYSAPFNSVIEVLAKCLVLYGQADANDEFGHLLQLRWFLVYI